MKNRYSKSPFCMLFHSYSLFLFKIFFPFHLNITLWFNTSYSECTKHYVIYVLCSTYICTIPSSYTTRDLGIICNNTVFIKHLLFFCRRVSFGFWHRYYFCTKTASPPRSKSLPASRSRTTSRLRGWRPHYKLLRRRDLQRPLCSSSCWSPRRA